MAKKNKSPTPGLSRRGIWTANETHKKERGRSRYAESELTINILHDKEFVTLLLTSLFIYT